MALGKSHGLSATLFSLETVFSIPLRVLEGNAYYEVIYRLSTIEVASVHVIFLHQLDVLDTSSICRLVIWEGFCMGLLPHTRVTWLCRKGTLSAVAFDFRKPSSCLGIPDEGGICILSGSKWEGEALELSKCLCGIQIP